MKTREVFVITHPTENGMFFGMTRGGKRFRWNEGGMHALWFVSKCHAIAFVRTMIALSAQMPHALTLPGIRSGEPAPKVHSFFTKIEEAPDE
jgi:hypothetical protein